MSGTTPGGLPYPTGTDLVRDGDNAIKALAEALDPRTAGLIAVGNYLIDGSAEVRNTPYEPGFIVNLPRAANTVLLTAYFGLNFIDHDSGEARFDAYAKWDGVELFHLTPTPRTQVSSGDTYRQYVFRAAITGATAGNHTALLGMYSGMGLIMHTKIVGISFEALGN